MEAFRVLISRIRQPESVDFITQLPLEIALLILKCLDDDSFRSAAKVSQQWAKICRCSGRRTNNNTIHNYRNNFQHWTSRSISMTKLLKQKKEANRMEASDGHSRVPYRNTRLPCNGRLVGKFGSGRLRL